MKLLTGLFRAARKRALTTDNDMGMFREKLTELVEKKAELPDEEVAKRVDELKEMTIDLPESEDKSKLDLYLEDIKSIKEQDDATAKEAVSMVSDLFEKLDTEAMKDVPDAGGEETKETPLVESKAPDAEAPDAESPFNEYTLEEIYQYCKKRKAEEEGEATDGCAEDSAEEKEEDEEKEVVSDHAPRIPVTMNGTTAAKGSLADMFNKIKEGGR